MKKTVDIFPKWIKRKRNKLEKFKKYGLCPICGEDTLEVLINSDKEELRERCKRECYVYDFTLMKRIR